VENSYLLLVIHLSSGFLVKHLLSRMSWLETEALSDICSNVLYMQMLLEWCNILVHSFLLQLMFLSQNRMCPFINQYMCSYAGHSIFMKQSGTIYIFSVSSEWGIAVKSNITMLFHEEMDLDCIHSKDLWLFSSESTSDSHHTGIATVSIALKQDLTTDRIDVNDLGRI
jgi:hypothetical protein